MKVFRTIAFILIGLIVVFFGFGMFNPEIEYTNTVLINATPERSYALFNDTSKLKEWMPGFKSLKLMKGDGNTRGSKWDLVLEREGQSFDMSQTLVSASPGTQYSMLIENAVLHNSIDMYFKGVGDKTEITVKNRVEGNNIIWRSLFYFFGSRLKEQSDEMYNDLKTMIETSVN